MLAIADVYGPRQRAGDGLVARLRAAAAAGEAPSVGGDERQTRDLVFIDDTVDALVRGAQRGSGLVVNIGTGVQTPVRDLWERIGGPGRLPVRPGPADDGRPARFALSAVRARIHLAWEPWTTLDEGLRAMGRTAP
jgi:UDP-glucose 4-epimerase